MHWANKQHRAGHDTAELHRSLRDYYSIGKTLGRGACGRVNRCTSVLDGGQYAVKEGLAHNPEDYTGRHGLLNELQIMQQLCLSPCAPACAACMWPAALNMLYCGEGMRHRCVQHLHRAHMQ